MDIEPPATFDDLVATVHGRAATDDAAGKLEAAVGSAPSTPRPQTGSGTISWLQPGPMPCSGPTYGHPQAAGPRVNDDEPLQSNPRARPLSVEILLVDDCPNHETARRMI